ncbi:hypothetical protein [Shewanella sp.]|uniref:hypothetical protein n=1 Tax=Shewanella sp. TaxID=50422 RepID=UPI001EC0B9DA|nr:hypothetical protein [Shewanella sp.]NRB24759.1 hypothetical protein [Shewanella sp.]
MWLSKCIVYTILMLFTHSGICDEEIYYEGGSIFYNADIHLNGFKKAQSLFNKHTDVNKLVVNSFGGYTNTAIEFAKWIKTNNLDIEVDKYCISSCANYLFLAGSTKFINIHSLLGWHGGVLQFKDMPLESGSLALVMRFSSDCNFELISKKKDLMKKKDIILECEFFNQMKVNQLITMFGQVKSADFYTGKTDFWSYSLDALSYLGVQNVVLVDRVWEPYTEINGKEITYFDSKDITKSESFAKKLLNYPFLK